MQNFEHLLKIIPDQVSMIAIWCIFQIFLRQKLVVEWWFSAASVGYVFTMGMFWRFTTLDCILCKNGLQIVSNINWTQSLIIVLIVQIESQLPLHPVFLLYKVLHNFYVLLKSWRWFEIEYFEYFFAQSRLVSFSEVAFDLLSLNFDFFRFHFFSGWVVLENLAVNFAK